MLIIGIGVEAGDLSLKLARHWGYKIKNIPENKATILFAESNFWGRSLAAISASTEPLTYQDFGPLMPNFEKIPYDDLNILEEKFKANPHICAYMMEPIQGEAGVRIPKVLENEYAMKIIASIYELITFLLTFAGRLSQRCT